MSSCWRWRWPSSHAAVYSGEPMGIPWSTKPRSAAGVVASTQRTPRSRRSAGSSDSGLYATHLAKLSSPPWSAAASETKARKAAAASGATAKVPSSMKETV